MTEKSIIIIGAGIAGLSAGCYARLNGYPTQIFELHSLPGGLCTSWGRKGYTLDGCIHWLVGTGEGSSFRKIWDELGALDGKQIVNHAEFLRVVGPQGKTFILYTDPDRLEKHMLELASQDEAVIRELTGALRTIAKIDMPAISPQSFGETLGLVKNAPGMLTLMGIFRMYGKMPLSQFTARISDPFLREALECSFDGHATLFEMLEGKYLGDEQRQAYASLPIFDPIIQLSLGVDRDLSDQPHMITYLLDQPFAVAGEERRRLGVKNYNYDPTLAPAGKSVIEVMFNSNYAYWKNLAGEPERYEAEKKEVAIRILGQLEKIYPGLTGQVEVVDVATPLTYERYTGNWKGSMEGWLITTQSMDNVLAGKKMSRTLPGLENFYQIGQWVEPGGGLPPAATSAREVIQTICKKDGRRFTTRGYAYKG